MNTALLRQEVQDYLQEHKDFPLDKFIFKGSPFTDISIQELAQQLDGKRRTKNKLPLWHETKGILFPPKLNLEQASSAITARYKASLMPATTLLDMTGGFGVDSYYFSLRCKQLYYIEQSEEVYAFAKANFQTLKSSGITYHNGDAIAYLKNSGITYDTIYVDPGRRVDKKGKVFLLADCLPNVVEHMELLLAKAKTVCVKTSPLLDITAVLAELKNVSKIYIIAVNNEVKELLWFISQKAIDSPEITAVNCRNDGASEELSFPYLDSKTVVAAINMPLQYLYEPNAALLKSGAFDWIATHYKIAKLHKHTHLYTSTEIIDFHGRVFCIEKMVKYRKNWQQEFPISKANITTRNFPITVAQIRKRHKIKEGGNAYLFFTTLMDDSLVIIVCSKMLSKSPNSK